ncbi:MAG: L,D-transpeptidase family protein [Candidatus Binatus sp.]|uniref:L,D-transpeptidase family protein n=1 Tax=Candidatus Binatus sp. TaxID=2811406 RepID=UPI0027278F55|nr:L,D-transpeptidase family protein [Candidatus Binatus sp.]MDO8430801.1 L,D-transpeptidase family protein [Candidatus Binatus sp.]
MAELANHLLDNAKPGSLVLQQLIKSAIRLLSITLLVALVAIPPALAGWTEDEFEHRPLYAYPLPHGKDNIIGNLITYQLLKGDTLLDVGRWFGVTAREISNANDKIDWWAPPAGRQIVLPDEHILPDTPHVGIVLNIPEMRVYYYYPSPTGGVRHKKRKTGVTPAAYVEGIAPVAYVAGKKHAGGAIVPTVVYTFPVGLGRYDWKTPIGAFTVRGKTRNPTWVVPENIYKEHLERDGEAEHVVSGTDPDNPLGRYRIELTLPSYALHGTNVPWGVGMEVSHGCVRLYPEDIQRLFNKVKIGTPGQFVYQPVKFGWRGDALYVEVHEDLYGRYAGIWAHAQKEVERLGIEDQVDMQKLEKAIEQKSGVPTYIMPGPAPGTVPGSAG